MSKLTGIEKDASFTNLVKIGYQDLINAGDGGEIVIATIPANGAVELVGVAKTEEIVGSSTLFAEVGVDGTADGLIAAFDVGAQTAPLFNTGGLFTTAGTSEAVSIVAAGADPVDVILTITDANIANLTAGEVTVGARVLDLGRFG
jgi:hypothetical protein